jgi:hypothetical protein
VLSVRERVALWRDWRRVLVEHERSQDAARRSLNSALRDGRPRFVLRVAADDGCIWVELDDGLVLRLTGIESSVAMRLFAAASGHRVRLVHGSVRQVVFEVLGEGTAAGRAHLCLEVGNVERVG